MSGLQGFAGSPQTTDWDVRLRVRVRENNAPIRNEDIVSYDTDFFCVADNCHGPKTRLVLSKVYIISSYIITKTLASKNIMTLVLKALCRAAMLRFLRKPVAVKSWMRPIRKQFLWLFAKVINILTAKVGGSFVEVYCYPGGGTPHMKGVGMLVRNF